ncbi:MFS transporter [Legionella sp. CNM-4043-24]|uniref:MFS transporter n=1 Tax=Legionella sp. CNM-4043-24 TaxID=3421646 RepID=UPI00403B1159
MRHRVRIIAAGMLGNLIETFDMAICGLLSMYLARYLIGNEAQGLSVVFATFFAGYLARPIGAMVLGLFSDGYGRKITLAASILSMGIATTLIGFVPPASSAGIASISALLILRIVQSFSCGSEYLNSSAYLVENSDESNRGFSGSWASFGAMSGFLLASIIALIVALFIQKYPDLEWAIWRVPFVLALAGSSVGLYVRLCVPESMEFVTYYANSPKPRISKLFVQSFQYIAGNKLKSLYVFVLSCLGVTTTFQIYIYGPVQAQIYGSFSDHQILISNIISLLVLLAVFPFIGRLSDKINREKIVFYSSIGFLVLSQPLFYLLSYGTFGEFVLMQSLISIPAAAYYATVPVMLTEMFPINLRCTVLSVLYSTAASLSAGLAPLLSLVLLKRTHSSISPALLTISLVVICLIVMCLWQLRNLKRVQIFTSTTT